MRSRPLARRLAEERAPEAKEKGLSIELELQKNVWARADEEGLRLAADHLLSNALKYTSEGTVAVRAYRSEKTAVTKEETAMPEEGTAVLEEEAAMLEVGDTGIGMEPGRAKRLFEPFRQALEGTTRRFEGAALACLSPKRWPSRHR